MIHKTYTLFLVFILCLSLRGQDAVDGIYSKVDERPSPIKTANPDYPTDLKREGINGLVSVITVIDEKGDVIDVSVKKASHQAFEQPAKDAIKKWKFTPAKKDGKAVKVRVTIPVKFSVSD
jgi:periplasmic protein TonB